MAVRLLPEPMRVFRIGDPKGRYPIYSGEGAAVTEGRWHSRGQEVIYASVNYATAMLERLAHYNGVLPQGQHFRLTGTAVRAWGTIGSRQRSSRLRGHERDSEPGSTLTVH